MSHGRESSRGHWPRSLGDESGITIAEVLVSIVILVSGMLGTVMLINAANATTLNNNLRETATNLSREAAEAANGLTYASVTNSGVVTGIQAQGSPTRPGPPDGRTSATAPPTR